MRKLLHVFEHETLRVAGNGLSLPEFDALVKFNQRHGSCFFTVGFRSLTFTSYVGVIQVGGLTIEILPKADKADRSDTVRWRNLLVDMLRSCGYLRLAKVSRADLHLRRASLFDLYMEAFLEEVRVLLHQGLVKQYRQAEGNIPVLKGRLQFNRHLSENLIHRERFYTVHTRYDRDNMFNCVLNCALHVVNRVARSPHVQRQAKGIIEHFEDIPYRRVTSDTFKRLRYGRNTERYRYAVALARLIILNFQPDVRAGREDVLAFLFNMNDLFEAYVFQQVRRAATRYGRDDVDVRGQCSKRFWHSTHSIRSIRPDIVVTWGDGGSANSAILDTKWKIPKTRHPDDADLKQMYAYNLQFGAQCSYLLYPKMPGIDDVYGWFESVSGLGDLDHDCGMWFVELFDGDQLRRDMGHEILTRLLNNKAAE